MRPIVVVLCCLSLLRVARADDPPPTLVVSILVDGTIVVGSSVVADDKLDAKFRELAAAAKDRPVMVDADKAVEHKRVDAIVARAKAAGLTHVTVGHAPQPPRSSPPPRPSH